MFKVGTYKSFVEPYTRDEMSPRARKRTSAGWISCGNPMWPTWPSSGDRTGRRGTGQDRFLELLRKAGGNAANYALDNGLVDQLATRDEMTQAVIKEVGER